MRVERKSFVQAAGWLSAVAIVLLSGTSTFAQQLREEIIQRIVAGQEPAEAKEAGLGEYWIGAKCTDIDAALRSQLDLPAKQGMLVVEVLPDSPAAKAGIRLHDVIVAINDKALEQGRSLIDAVQAAKDSPMSVAVVRKGQRETIHVTPEKTPADRQSQESFFQPGPDGDVVRWLERFRPGEEGGPLVMRYFRPGRLMADGPAKGSELPSDMSVNIKKEGKEPAKISVKQGDKSWEVTEDKLGELPEDVRGHVEAVLGRGPGWLSTFRRMAPGPFNVEVHPRVEAFRYDPKNHADGQHDQRLEEMRKQIDAMRKSLDDLIKESKSTEKSGQEGKI